VRARKPSHAHALQPRFLGSHLVADWAACRKWVSGAQFRSFGLCSASFSRSLHLSHNLSQAGTRGKKAACTIFLVTIKDCIANTRRYDLEDQINEQNVRATADALISTGLSKVCACVRVRVCVCVCVCVCKLCLVVAAPHQPAGPSTLSRDSWATRTSTWMTAGLVAASRTVRLGD
jgi:hypothetical protein